MRMIQSFGARIMRAVLFSVCLFTSVSWVGAQTLADIQIEVEERQYNNLTNPPAPVKKTVFNISPGVIRVIFEESPYRSGPGKFWFGNVPGDPLVPGRSLSEDTEPPQCTTNGSPTCRRIYIRWVDAPLQNVEMGLHPTVIYAGFANRVEGTQHRQRMRVSVEHLGKTARRSNAQGLPDLNGSWKQGSYAVQITQNGSQARATCTYSLGDRKISWVVDGTVNRDGRFTGKLTHTQGVPSTTPGYSQSLDLTLSPDGKTLSGQAVYDGGGGNPVTWISDTVPMRPPPGEVAADPSTTPPPVSGMRLRAESRKLKPGETVTLPVWLDKGAGLANINFNLVYDANVVRAGNVSKGAVVPSRSLYEVNSSERGVVRVGLADSRDFSGSGTIAQVSFKAVGQPGSRTTVRIQVTTVSSADGRKPSIQTLDGSIEIVSEKGETPGDSNGNGTLDAVDALDALKMSVKLIPEKQVSDIDQDGQVTSTDARLILQKVVRK